MDMSDDPDDDETLSEPPGSDAVMTAAKALQKHDRAGAKSCWPMYPS